MDAPRTRYTRLGSAHIAYQVLGDGPPLLLLLGVSTHVEAMWEEPALARFLRRLASFSQLILHDRRGSGLSDPIADASGLDVFCDDAMAVVRACGAGGTVVVGANEASLLALPLAARVPEQVRAVAVINGTARLMEAEDYPIGVPRRRGRRYISDGTTAYADQPMGLQLSAPSKLGDPTFEDWAQRYQRLAGSPGSLKRVAALIGEADVRALLPSISQPALVAHRAGNRFIRVDHARFLAEHLPNPRLVVLAGADHLVWVGPDTDRIADEIEELVTGAPATPSAEDSIRAIGGASRLLRGRYELKERLGAGSRATVWRAFDHQLHRDVTLKIRPAGGKDNEELLAEARTLLGLRPHAGLPMVRDDFFAGDSYVLVMDRVEGQTLARLVAERGDPGLAPSAALAYLKELAKAIDHLHAHRPPVVHGDVNPANATVTADGRVVLVDLGMVGMRARSDTAGYVAPEVAAGEQATPAADIYGLAATARTLLSGAPPATGRPAWEGLDPNVVGGFERGLRRGLAVDPSLRPGTAGELIERLQAALAGALPIGVVTFCLTDIEDSTRLWDTYPDAMGPVIAAVETLIADTVESHAGRLIKSRGEGDSTLSVFTRASDAAAAAVEIQRRLAAQVWPAGTEPLVRVALHTGEAELREGDYYGPTLNRAARLRGLGDGGQILCSHALADLISDQLPVGVTLTVLGSFELRGLSRNETVHRLDDQNDHAPE